MFFKGGQKYNQLMLKKKYSIQISRVLAECIKPMPKVFIFGSSLSTRASFADVDVGLLGGEIKTDELYRAKEKLEESTLPYKVDLVDFNLVESAFREEVLSKKIQWLT